jgi:hypothetical protein
MLCRSRRSVKVGQTNLAGYELLGPNALLFFPRG